MTKKTTIWIDFENAPHVWVMSPIIESFKKEGNPLLLTARDFSYTRDLCNRLGYDFQTIGPLGSGKNTFSKIIHVINRAIRLFIKIGGERKNIAFALSHGSRSQIIAAHFLGIPIVSLDDYEFSNQSLIRFMNHLLVPFPIPKETWGRYANKIINYPGLKEELYLSDFNSVIGSIKELQGVNKVKILFRPESRFSHYRSSLSQILQEAIINHVSGNKKVILVMLPRDDEQAKELKNLCRKSDVSFWIPDRVLDGPTLLSAMDLVLSGGGTMTREAAVLGIPSYSFFAGQWGAVDKYLQSQGRVIKISSIDDIKKIAIKKRENDEVTISKDAINFINDFIKERMLCKHAV